MAQARKQLPSARRSGKRISSVAQAFEVMGGEDRVAKWLRVDKSELNRMRDAGLVDRGYFAHFYVTLTALGHTPMPRLFGLKSWRTVIMPGMRSL